LKADTEILMENEKEIHSKLEKDIYVEDNNKLEEVVAKLLIDKKLTISTAESCTGGLLSGRLINYPGISSVFMEGMVTYSNTAKMTRLGVKKETLDNFGAVSFQTAQEMALGIATSTDTNIGISVTGIAGPDGGTKDKPVGLVYIGLYLNGEVKVKKYNFSGDRQSVRNRTVIAALDWLRSELISI
jgi:PncC family amidohydrolase